MLVENKIRIVTLISLLNLKKPLRILYDLNIPLKDFFKIQPGIDVNICREKYFKPGIKSSILKETVYAD